MEEFQHCRLLQISHVLTYLLAIINLMKSLFKKFPPNIPLDNAHVQTCRLLWLQSIPEPDGERLLLHKFGLFANGSAQLRHGVVTLGVERAVQGDLVEDEVFLVRNSFFDESKHNFAGY